MKSGKRSTRIMLAVPLAIFTMVGVLSSVPAVAQSLPTASANLAASDREILAGGSRTFAFTVNQPSPADCGGVLEDACPNGINFVKIQAPPGAAPFSDVTRRFNISAGTAPSGWQTILVPPSSSTGAVEEVIFKLPNPDSTGFTGSQPFSVTSAVPIPGADIAGDWVVSVSNNGGQTERNAGGNLGTTIRVLRMTAGLLTGPTKAVGTGKVTGLQTGITAECTVENLGSRTITVTPSLNAPGFSNVSTPAAQDVAASGGTATFEFTMTADNVSSQTNRTLTCNGNGTNSEGSSITTSLNNKQFVIPVQPPAVFDYVKVVRPPTFSPRALAPEATATFLATIRKNPSTSPGVDLDPATTKLVFRDGETVVHEIALGTAVDVPAGALSGLVLTFGPTALPAAMTPGQYSVSLDITGEDKNGAPVSFVPVPSFDEALTLDAGLPEVENLDIEGVAKPPNFRDDATVTGDEGYAAIEEAAKPGTPIPLTGEVFDGLEADSGERAACSGGPSSGELQPGECRVAEARLLQFSDYQGTLPIADSTIICPSVSINGSGQITGSCPTAGLSADAKSVMAMVDVEDAVGLEATGGPTTRLHVDQQIPDIVSARTVRYTDGSETERQNRIVVTFNECISREGAGSNLPIAANQNDWMPTGNAVTNVEGPDCPAETVTDDDPDGVSTITLTTQDDYDDDGDHGTLTYNPNCQFQCSGQTLQDRVRNIKEIPDSETILDGIAPKTPQISIVSVTDGRELSRQDGEFFTNTNTPTFRIVNPSDQMNRAVKAGYTIKIYEETNTVSGLQTDGASPDALRGEQKVDGDADCTGEENEVTGEVPVCEVDVATDFSPDHPATGNAALDVYVVAEDTLPPANGGPNVSVPLLDALNLDFVVPTLLSATPEAGQIRMSFSEAVPRGRNFSGDWNSRDDFNRALQITGVSVPSNLAERVLTVGSSYYDPEKVAFVKYFYFGPESGSPDEVKYEDRATNGISTTGVVCLPAGVAAELC